jgi:outer membrane protein TolC
MPTKYRTDRYVALLICLVFPAFSLLAQSKVYLLQDLTNSAKLYLPQVLEKQALVNSAQAEVTDVKHSFLPLLRLNEQVNLGTDNSLAGSYFPFGVVPSTSSGVRGDNISQSSSGNLAVFYAEYELVDFGYRQSKVNDAKSRVDLQQADLARAIYLIKVQTATLFFNLLKTQFRLEVDQQNADRYSGIFQIIHALTESGLKPGSDSSLAKAELSKSRIRLNQTMGTIRQLKEQLSYITGIAADQLVIDTATQTYIHLKSDMQRLATDLNSHPLLMYYERLRNTFISNEALISKSYLPKISLTGAGWARGSSIGYDDHFQSLSYGLGYQRFNYLAGISFQYDLLNGIHRKDRLNVSRFETTASDFALKQEQLALESAARQAERAIETSEINLLELPVQLKASSDTYNQKLAQYKAGIINLIDLTNAAFVLDRSQNDFIETLGDWYLAQLDKAYSTGNIDQFIDQIK